MILVTTALEESFPSCIKEEVLFLGEWCKIYDRKQIWSKFDSQTMPYHWNDRNKFHNDYIYLTGVYETFLVLTSQELNKIHGENNSLDYWRIIIGPWLRRFIDIFYDRYLSINNALRIRKKLKTKIIEISYDQSVPIDFSDFKELCISDKWNHFIYSFLLKKTECDIEYINPTLDIDHIKIKRNKIKSALMKLNSYNKIYFHTTNISKFKLFKLQLFLKQIPALDYNERVLINSQFNKKDRNSICLQNEAQDEFEELLSKIIKYQIPKSYIESYKKLKNFSLKSHNSKPRIILTSVAQHEYDDFKIWAAMKIKEGSNLIIAQHGGYYGTDLFASFQDHELKVADLFFSWGWKNKNNICPMPTSKGISKIKSDPKGNILFILNSVPRYHYISFCAPIASQYIDDFHKITNMIHNQKKEIKKLIRIREYNDSYGWCQRNRMIDLGLGSNLDKTEELSMNIFKRLMSCRLCVTTSNGTTFLETFASNFPTLIYFDLNYWELNPNAKVFFDNLEKVGIFHSNASSLKKILNKIYDNPEEWWLSDDVQDAKNMFCAQFLKNNYNFTDIWTKKIKRVSKRN